ncbi:MAG: carboxypeptidase-like regulatory domain-containing protein, partial [Planctomycetaceae bacterium]|nr:carboxypeptidase-like regulatory domain-containing protein [Planctomycetaceae bacterium]
FPVSGTVRYPDCSPVENSEIVFRLKTEWIAGQELLCRWAKSNEQGEFTMYLTPGEYDYKVFGPRKEATQRMLFEMRITTVSPQYDLTVGTDGPIVLDEIILPNMPGEGDRG